MTIQKLISAFAFVGAVLTASAVYAQNVEAPNLALAHDLTPPAPATDAPAAASTQMGSAATKDGTTAQTLDIKPVTGHPATAATASGAETISIKQ